MTEKFFGAYIGKETFLHRRHSVAKLIFTLLFIITAGVTLSVHLLFFIGCLWLAVGRISGLSFKEILLPLKMFRFFIVFTFLVQLFISPTGGISHPDSASLLSSIFFTGRLIVMIGFSSLFAMLTPQLDIVRLFRLIFTPLKLIKLDPRDLALSMLIALRFIPLLFTEGQKIIDSQRLKGILPEKGEKCGRIKIIKASASLIIPLFVRTFHYADQIAVTLGYRRHDSAFLKLPALKVADYALILMSLGSCGILILLEHGLL